MAAPSFTSGQVLTAAELNQLAQMDIYPNAVSSSTACVAGNGYIVTTGTSSLTMTLPTPTAGIFIGVKKVDNTTGTITVTAGSGNILGPGVPAATASIPVSAYGAYVTLMADGTNWHIVAGQQDSGWLPFSYSNSYASNEGPATGYTAAGYRITGNVVRLGGSVKTGTTGNAIATLPAGYRPAYANVYLNSFASAAGADPCTFDITSAGVITPTFPAGATPILDGLTFTVD
jgi:hypothetical protein